MRKYLGLLVLLGQTIMAQSVSLDAIDFQSIGPTIMSGRVVDLAVNPENPIEFYVAYASGGLWYTNNNGSSFSPVMDTAPTLNCGTVTVDWKSGTIWVGTGEVNSSRSSYSGIGVLKSTDKGKTWQNLGLPESHHISRIAVNPTNTNEMVVGVLGHLYTPNADRGIYKTTDGGATWNKSLYINNQTGIIDISVAPNNPTVLFAAAWQKDRKAWNFTGNGAGSGIYKSTDFGTTWQLISTPSSGFPTGEKIGRIGLYACSSDLIYAVVDNQNLRPSAKNEKPTDANSALVDTEVVGCEVYKSNDGGATWVKKNATFIDDMYYSYGYYFANISVDSQNSNRLYIGGVELLFSENGGETFTSISKENVHADHHVTWINPKNSHHVINGNDGGVNITYDNGQSWFKCNNQAVGQLYAVNVDYQDNYKVYGGLQDNGVWFGPNNYIHSREWQQTGKYPFQEILGGDGMQIQIDRRNPSVVYTGFQFGNYYRFDLKNDKSEPITPKADKEEEKFRYNWQTPILLSSHNSDILYFGSQFLHRSMNQGKTWEKISPDLTNGKVEGNVAYGTLTAISESKFQFGLLYAGSDDGKVHVTKDGGVSWQLISQNLPQGLWVSRVVASSHVKERVYLTLNGYRNDDFTAYVYVSDDYGATWNNISNSLYHPVNCIVEDKTNENLLFVGTDNGLFVSLDKGTSWHDFSNGMPQVAVHDLVIQNEYKELIVGTHGRSINKVSIDKLQALTAKIMNQESYLFPVKSMEESKMWGDKYAAWSETIEPQNSIWFYSNTNKEVSVLVENSKKQLLFSKKMMAKKGMNKVDYDVTMNEKEAENWNKSDKNKRVKKAKNQKYYLPASKYTVILQSGENRLSQPFEITSSKTKDDEK